MWLDTTSAYDRFSWPHTDVCGTALVQVEPAQLEALVLPT